MPYLKGEAQAWKGGEPVALSDRPMDRWESTLKLMKNPAAATISKDFFAEIMERGWAKNPKQTTIYHVNWLRKKIHYVDYLVTLAVEADVLEILMKFIHKTEFMDNDILIYLECV